MEKLVLNLLETKIPANYLYHNLAHSLYVREKAMEIGRHEGCSEDEMELLSTAALWHDIGYVKTYNNHEEVSCIITKEELPKFGFSIADTDLICSMIMATKIPQSPKNKLDEIIADADLEYLGTASIELKSDMLFRELQSIDPLMTEEKWRQMQISFLQKHHYFTNYCKKYREPSKQIYLQKLTQGIP
jgi:putative nucleotidyltransferase with HDIG domain